MSDKLRESQREFLKGEVVGSTSLALTGAVNAEASASEHAFDKSSILIESQNTIALV